MKKSTFNIIALSLISVFVFCDIANAYWIWTPQTKKFINPKYAVKDSPKEQYDWAMSFYDAKDFQRSATEFEKLARQYEFSEYASKAQYYVGLCYENMSKYYIAFQNYQKTIDNFPHISNTDEILAREFAIGNIYLGKASPKVMGTDIMAPLDRAVEIFKKVVENAPYGKHAEEAQFKLGEALKKSERYEEAVTAFHKIAEDYPNSKWVTQAMYEESHCAYKASLKPAYDASATDNAIKTFEKFTYKNKDADLAENATTTMKRLKDNVSEKSFRAAEFYETQGKTQAAMIYYQDVIDSHPDSAFTNQAKAKIDALKAKENKKASMLLEPSKKKSKPIAREDRKKRSWRAFSFKSKKPDSEKKASPTPQNTPGKRSWNLFNLGVKKEPVVKETPKREWKPLSFSARKEEAKQAPEAPVQESPVDQIKKEAKPETQIVEAPKKKWKPLSFDAKKEPASKETPQKKEWKPLSFDTKKELVVKGARKKMEWKPLYFGTNDEPMGIKK